MWAVSAVCPAKQVSGLSNTSVGRAEIRVNDTINPGPGKRQIEQNHIPTDCPDVRKGNSSHYGFTAECGAFSRTEAPIKKEK